MKKNIFFILIFTLITIFSCSSHEKNKPMPLVKNGTLDLRMWNLKTEGPVKLDGEWNFYQKKFVPPENIKKNEGRTSKIKVPLPWSSAIKYDKNIIRDGYATYHLKILLDPVDTPLCIKFNIIASAYEAYLNGKKISQVGKIGKSFETMIPKFLPGIISFYDNSNEFDLVIQVSNFHQKHSGILDSIYLGLPGDIIKIRDNKAFLAFFLVGTFIIMFFYHIGIFAIRPDERIPLYFAFLCLLVALRMMSFNEIILLYVFPDISMSWIKTIEFISFYLGVATSCLFVYKLFPQESNKIIFFILNIPVIIVSIITIFTPPIIFTFIIKIVQIESFIIFIYVTYVNILAVMRNREGAVAHFIGIFTVTIFASNDILYSMGYITSKHITPYGILVMIICQAYVLSTKFSRAFSTVEKLSSSLETKNFELEDLNQNLEKKINERTQELTTARNRLWAEMEVAKKIQTVLLPKKPMIPGFQIATYMLPTKEVGGDYFDIINTDENDWIMIGDVSGHGVPAGLVMMMAQSIIRSHVMSNPAIKPSELLENINLAIGYNLKNMNEQKFMTISALSYDKKNKIIFSGRHEDVLIYRKESNQVEVVKTAGICISPMLLGEKNKNLELQINQGDIILLYTDGIIESWLGKEESVNRENMFGQEKLVSILKKTGSLSPEEIKKSLLDELEDYTIDDDVTFLIIKKS